MASLRFAFAFVLVVFVLFGSGILRASGLVQRTLVAAGEHDELLLQLTSSYGFVSDDVRFDLPAASSAHGVGVDVLDRVAVSHEADFAVSFSKLPDAFRDDWVQVPLAVFPTYLIFSVPGVAWCPSLLLTKIRYDGLWTGTIVQWSQFSASFPADDVLLWTLSYDDPAVEYASLEGVLGRGLSAAVDGFAAVYEACGGRLSCALAAAAGANRTRSLPAATTSYADLATQMMAAGNGVAFVPAADAGSACVFPLSMSASVYRPPVQVAQVQYALPSDLGSADSLDRDFMNMGYAADGKPRGYPLVAAVFAAVPRRLEARGCAGLQAVVEFMSWAETNANVGSAMEADALYFPLTDTLRVVAANALSGVSCNGRALVVSAYLAASSPSTSLLPVVWAIGYTPAETGAAPIALTYDDTATDAASRRGVANGVLDFGFTYTYSAPNGSLVAFPVAAEPLVAAYNVLELSDAAAAEPLVLSTELAAAILLAEVDMWNDTRIAELNPGIVHLLPNRSIVVVLDMGGSPDRSGGPTGGDDNRPLYMWLSATVPGFSAQVMTDLGGVSYPVAATSRGILAGDQGIIKKLAATQDAIGWAGLSTVLAERTLRTANHYRPLSQPVPAATGAPLTRRSTPAGVVLQPNSTAILAAMNAGYSEEHPHFVNATTYVLAHGQDAWPVLRWAYFYLRAQGSSTGNVTTNCNEMSSIVQWLYWTQTDTTTAQSLADGEGMMPFVSGDPQRAATAISSLASFTCDGEPVFLLSACVVGGTICNNHGSCVSSGQNASSSVSCHCDNGWTGDRCQNAQSSSSNAGLIIGLSVGIGVGLCLLLILVLAATLPVLLVALIRSRRRRPEWEIRFSELQNLEFIGQGGYGKVYKGNWKGTDVAVKVIDRSRFPDTKRSRQAFAKEVEHMSLLRNPNIVMFMAAATSTAPMCLVMEYMALGSLYDLLHNELIDHMPFQLKSLILLHVARGMNFLHSSNIVHRDLKSLNVLLDSKWNAKVADFGLSTLASAGTVIGKDRHHFEGSVPWAAPELLNEQSDIDLFAADVYSFGIVTWEVLTREQPYKGKSAAAIAVAVLRDKCRPPLVSQEDYATAYLSKDSLECLPHLETLVTLIESCWSEEVSVRPTFLEITSNLASLVARLKSMNAGSSTGGISGSMRSSSSDYSGQGSMHSHSSHSSRGSNQGGMKHIQRFHYYDGPHAIVCSDVAMAGTLWSEVPEAMKDATRLHNELLRSLLPRYGGYETMLPKIEGGAAGTFCMAFANSCDALKWCADVQRALLDADWPKDLLMCPPAQEVNSGGVEDKLIFRGLRVRMGIHFGLPRCHVDSMTKHVEYTGPAVQKAQELASRSEGGVVLMSEDALSDLKKDDKSVSTMLSGGDHIRALRDVLVEEENGNTLYELVLAGLEGRCQRTFIKDAVPLHHRRSMISSSRKRPTRAAADDSDSDDSRRGKEKYDSARSLSFIDPMLSGSMTIKKRDREYATDRKEPLELGFLNSANMCRTILNYRELLIEKPIGQGSFGIVHKARWKGVPVAVKTLTSKKRLSEEDMLDFRYEIAVLADLNHHNVLTFIGACLSEPHLAIVTEYMERGSLKDVLHNTSIKLPWALRLRMIRDAANGIRYLHMRSPSPIIHRDLKSSNLLVDESYTVKVGDFGLARIKGDNATMTRCGTPAWTAPEVLSAAHYDEKADVYSFSIIMWEVLTRRHPYEGRNFIKVTMDVLKGDRPTIPQDCPSDFSKLLRKCWQADPQKRPGMDKVLSTIERMLQRLDDDQLPTTLLADSV